MQYGRCYFTNSLIKHRFSIFDINPKIWYMTFLYEHTNYCLFNFPPNAWESNHTLNLFSGNVLCNNNKVRKPRAVSMSLRNGNNGVSVGAGERLYLGLDFGTSGARFAIIDKDGTIQTEAKREYPLYLVSFYFPF